MSLFVLVPGAWYGAWVYDGVARYLRAAGHDVLAVTLSSVEPSTNLDTHIAEVVTMLDLAQRDDVLLCGHSYAGMVISGAADLAPQPISGLVYIDAYVPIDGDSCWSLTTDAYRARFISGAGDDGLAVAPPAGLDARATPHPLASLVQRIRLSSRPAIAIKRTFVYLTGWRGSPFEPTYERLREDPEWTVHVRPTGHDIMLESPADLARILLACGRSPDR